MNEKIVVYILETENEIHCLSMASSLLALRLGMEG
jgi:hypothetical protein